MKPALALALLVTVLAACGGAPAAPSAPAGASSADPASSAGPAIRTGGGKGG